jgi:hypothetical protein
LPQADAKPAVFAHLLAMQHEIARSAAAVRVDIQYFEYQNSSGCPSRGPHFPE